MADDSLDILVKISSDVAGAKEAAQELDALGDKVRQYNEGLREQAKLEKERESVPRERGEGGRSSDAESAKKEAVGESDARPVLRSSTAEGGQHVPTGEDLGQEMAALPPSLRFGEAGCRDAATGASGSESGRGGGEGVEDSRSQIPSPQPSPRSGGERESETKPNRGEQAGSTGARGEETAAETGVEQRNAAALAGQRASLQEATALIARSVQEFGGFTEEVIRLAGAVAGLAKTAREMNARLGTIEEQVRATHNP